MVEILLGAFPAALVVSFIACAIALKLFPWFRSGEHKEGVYRPDQSTGTYHLDTRHPGGLQRLRHGVSALELPLVGGLAMVVAVLVAGVAAGFALRFDRNQWVLLGLLLGGMVGFALVGVVDDWLKYHRGIGISEVQKFAGVALVSLAAAVALNRLFYNVPLSARLPYPPYSDVPGLGHLLVSVHYAWIVFFLLMTMTVGTTTSLAVDFADGMDGLCGGLLLSAALAFAVILLNQGGTYRWPLIVAALAIGGSALGYLPFNWPSPWRGRGLGRGKRRARLIMGDTGSLALGGLLALVAVMSRLEVWLILIGGVFVLEGLSALVSARILVRFFRHFLVLERFSSSRGFPHSEFPLPFLGTPMHHHFDLLNWDRERLVYAAWLLSAVLGLLGVASTMGQYTWERYLARLVALVILVLVWQLGPRTRSFFIGVEPLHRDGVQHLALYYGYPFRLCGRNLYGRIDSTAATPAALETAGERLTLWQRVSVFDARALLGLYCYRAGAYQDAYRIWERIPAPNMELRPEMAELLEELRHRLAVAQAGDVGTPGSPPDEREAVPVESGVHAQGAPPPQSAPGTDPATSQWRMQAPSAGMHTPPHLEPADPDTSLPLWRASAWAALATDGVAAPSHDALPLTGPAAPTAPAAGERVPPPAGATSSPANTSPADSGTDLEYPLHSS